jgi:hypothetical protein
MSDKRNENTDKKGTCVYEKDIHVSHKGQGAATCTNREKGQGGMFPYLSQKRTLVLKGCN